MYKTKNCAYLTSDLFYYHIYRRHNSILQKQISKMYCSKLKSGLINISKKTWLMVLFFSYKPLISVCQINLLLGISFIIKRNSIQILKMVMAKMCLEWCFIVSTNTLDDIGISITKEKGFSKTEHQLALFKNCKAALWDNNNLYINVILRFFYL